MTREKNDAIWIIASDNDPRWDLRGNGSVAPSPMDKVLVTLPDWGTANSLDNDNFETSSGVP
jgi:hypothetical protein